MPDECKIETCENERVPGREFCSAHRSRLHRGKAMHKPIREQLTPFGSMIRAALSLSDASEADDYEKAEDRLRKAAMVWVMSVVGKKPDLEVVRIVEKYRKGKR